MKRLLLLVCGIFHFTTARAASKYVGEYSIDIGGGDAMSAVHLHILPSGKYAVTYFGGLQTGVWKELANGKLQLRQDHDPTYFYVYAWRNPALKDSVLLNFDSCQEGSAKVSLAAKPEFNRVMRPVFSAAAEQPAQGNEIRLAVGQVKALYLLENNEFKQALPEAERPRTPDNQLYSFLLDKKYNSYKVILNQAARQQPNNYVGEFMEGRLLLYRTEGPYPETINCREKRELGQAQVKEIEELMQQFGGGLSNQLEITEQVGDEEVSAVYQKLTFTTQSVNLSAITFVQPLFQAEAPAPAGGRK